MHIGVDEAGRGPLAGPVCAAAVILNPNLPLEGLADSKSISEKKKKPTGAANSDEESCLGSWLGNGERD